MIVETFNGIGPNEAERDLDFGDDLEQKMLRAVENYEINPTKANERKTQKTIRVFEAYIKKMNEKYNVR